MNSTTRPCVVAIAGGSGSGKSSLAGSVVSSLGAHRCIRLSHDDYYLPLPEHHRHDPSGYNFDEPAALDNDLLVQHLQALRRSQTVQVPVYDFASHSRTRHRPVAPKPFILVEGILVLSDARVRDLADLTVFVDAPEAVRLHRRAERDQRERGRTLEGILHQYFHTVRPMHEQHVQPVAAHVDLIVSGVDPLAHLRDRVLSHLHHVLEGDGHG